MAVPPPLCELNGSRNFDVEKKLKQKMFHCHLKKTFAASLTVILIYFVELNETLLETIVHHTPAGASTTTILQYAQEVTSS